MGFSEEELDEIDYRHNDFASFKNLLKEWLEWYPGDSRDSTAFPTYSSLQQALVNAGLGDAARDFATYEDIIKPTDDYNEDDMYYDENW